MIFVDDNVLCSTRRGDVETKLRQGLNISRKKMYTRGAMYMIGTWMGTQISIYTEIFLKE